MRRGYPLIPPPLRNHFVRDGVAEEVKVTGVVVTPMRLSPPEGDKRKRMDFLVRSKSLNSEVRRVIITFRQWARCITYYHDYYEDSYLMPLVVLSLTGDASDMFDWTCSVSPGDAQDLSELLQMLREHYCSFFTFQEQRNMVKNLCQGAHEDATDFMIRVGSSIGNLAKDWKGQITEVELKSLQYEVSLNGVREEIRHVLDSEIARHGQLTPHQMYEAVKKYKTYIAHNKRLKGKSASPHSGHQRAAALTSGYRPCFHKTTAFTASVEETPDPALSEPGPSLPEDEDHLGGESTQEGNERLYIPSFLEEALGGDCNLQIKMAHTMQAQEKCDRKCFICQSVDHLMKDHYQGKNGMGLLQQKGSPPKQVSSRDDQGLSTRSNHVSGSPFKVKGVPYLNPDPYCRFIGPKNLGEALIDGELATCLLDNGAQLNFITPTYAHKRGMDIMSLESLAQEVGGKIPPIMGIGGIMVNPEGFVMMNVQMPCVKGYNEDQIAIIMDDLGLKDCPVILGMPTIF